MRVSWLVGLFILTSGAVGNVSQAALVMNGSGHAVRVTDVEVDGLFYEVTFNVGSYNETWGTEIDPDPLPTFDGSEAAADQALQGIIDQLNAGGAALVADIDSGLTGDAINVPYFHDDTRFHARWTDQVAPLPWGGPTLLSHTRTATGTLGLTYAFAQFEQQASVPEPASFVLSGLGLATVAAMNRRRRQ